MPQVLVNVVLATDIFDPELNGLRKARWERAFSSDILSHEERNDLRATIVVSIVSFCEAVCHCALCVPVRVKYHYPLTHNVNLYMLTD